MRNTLEVLDEIEGFINSGAISEKRVRHAIKELVVAERRRRQATVKGIKKSNEEKLVKAKRFMRARGMSPITVEMLAVHMNVQNDTARKYLKTLEKQGEVFEIARTCDTKEALFALFKPAGDIKRPPAKRVYTDDLSYRVKFRKEEVHHV